MNALRVGGMSTKAGLSFVEQAGNLDAGQVQRIEQNAKALPHGYTLYWFFRSSAQPFKPLSQGGKAPREALQTRVTAIAELIASQSGASGNPLSVDELKAKIPEVAAIVYIVHEN